MDKNTLEKYSMLAKLFYYPDKDTVSWVKQIQEFFNEHYPKAGKELKGFTDFVCEVNLLELEELFTRSFDVQAITTLDIGYILFGDDYKRGELLVNLNREHREVNNDCYNELSDHLPNILCLISKMKEREAVDELVDKMIVPALKKMISEFDPEHIKKKKAVYFKHHKTCIEESEKYGTIYQKPLCAVYAILLEDFCITQNEEVTDNKNSDFLRSIKTEIEIDE